MQPRHSFNDVPPTYIRRLGQTRRVGLCIMGCCLVGERAARKIPGEDFLDVLCVAGLAPI